jgi:hypothetical protein
VQRAFRAFSRRGFLVGSAATLGALGAGAALVMRGDPDQYRDIVREPDGSIPDPVVLAVKELAVLTAVCDRLLPAEPGFPSAKELGIARRIDKELSFLRAKIKSDVQSALFVVEHGGIVHASPSRFCALNDEQRDERLVQMATGTEIERQVVAGLRILALFFYYADDRVWQQIGYAGPLVAHRSPPLSDSRIVTLRKG